MKKSLKKKHFVGLFLILITMLLAIHTSAAPGDLDTSFDGDGYALTSFSSGNDAASAIALQPDGKIIAVGYGYNGSNDDFALARYNTDGSLDTSFDGDGKVLTPIGTSIDRAWGIALQNDGKMVVVGQTRRNTGYIDFALARYNTDGSLDTTFSGDGIQITDFGGSNDFGKAIALQADGKIVVVGYTSNGSNSNVVLARYNSDGSLDTSFNGSGKVYTYAGDRMQAFDVAVQTDGKIVVIGEVTYDIVIDINTTITETYFLVIRYNSDGSLDTTFDSDGDNDGIVETPLSAYDQAQQLVIQPDGKIVVIGTTETSPGDYDFAVLRYTNSGALDTNFGTGGVTTTHFDDYDRASSVDLQSDGKIIVTGYAWNGSKGDFALARFQPNGAPDNSFGVNGKLLTPLVVGDNRAEDAHLQPDGKLVAVGYAAGSGTDFITARYLTSIESNATLNNSETQLIGDTGVEITLNSGGPCTFYVTKHSVPPGGVPTSPGELPVQWDLTTNCISYNIDLTFNYTDDELAHGNNITEANLAAYKFTGSSPWQLQGGTAAPATNSVTVANVTALSTWTLGDSGSSNGAPTAVTLNSFHTQPREQNLKGILALCTFLLSFGTFTLIRRRQ